MDTAMIILGALLVLETIAVLVLYKSGEDVKVETLGLLEKLKAYSSIITKVVTAIPTKNITSVNKGLEAGGLMIVHEVPVGKDGKKIGAEKMNIIKDAPKCTEPVATKAKNTKAKA